MSEKQDQKNYEITYEQLKSKLLKYQIGFYIFFIISIFAAGLLIGSNWSWLIG